MAFSLSTLWAVLAVVAANFALGFLWYGPLFAKPWMKAMGWSNLSEAELKEKQKSAMPGYMASIAGSIVAVLLVWILYGWAAASPEVPYTGPMLGLAIALAGFVAFYMPGTVTTRFFEGSSWTLTWIGAGYWAVSAMIQGLVVGFFASM